MVDRERIVARLERLDHLLGRLEAVRSAGHLPDELAQRLAAASRQRNLLVRLYLDIDDREVFAR